MKKPIVAFLLNFFLPGAGLAYLGRWKWGVANLCIVLAIGTALAFLLSESAWGQYGRYVAFACAGGSGALARALAMQMNQQRTNSAT